MFNKYNIIEITNHDRIVAVMNEIVKGNYSLNYEQYALTYDFILDFITQIKSWQSAEKLDAINIMFTEVVEAFNLVNDIVIYSVRVNILQRLICALLTTVYAHLLDKRNNVNVDDDKIIFYAFSFEFESVVELVFFLLDFLNWLFHQNCKKWKNWILDVYVKAVTITIVFRLVVNMLIKVHANSEIVMINSVMIEHDYRLTYVEHVNAVTIVLILHLWRFITRRFDLDRLSARMMTLIESHFIYNTRLKNNRWIFRFSQFTEALSARRYVELIKHLHLINSTYESAFF